MNNAMMVLELYRHNGCWVFDDENYDLVAEPFVSGVSEIIDELAIIQYGNTLHDKGLNITFSKNPFPNYQARIDRLREEYDGNWYEWKETNMEGWLCPALFNYFSTAPDSIYVSIKKVS